LTQWNGQQRVNAPLFDEWSPRRDRPPELPMAEAAEPQAMSILASRHQSHPYAQGRLVVSLAESEGEPQSHAPTTSKHRYNMNGEVQSGGREATYKEERNNKNGETQTKQKQRKRGRGGAARTARTEASRVLELPGLGTVCILSPFTTPDAAAPLDAPEDSTARPPPGPAP
jgi:hypothetical protein